VKNLKIVATAISLLLATQANAVIVDGSTWSLSNQANRGFGLIENQTGVKYDFGINGAQVAATYSQNEFVISGKAFSNASNSLVDVFLSYGNIAVTDTTISASNTTSTLGTIGGVSVNGALANGKSLTFDANSGSLKAWFMLQSGQKFADIHATATPGAPVTATPGAPITSAVSESATGLVFLGVLGVLAFGARRTQRS